MTTWVAQWGREGDPLTAEGASVCTMRWLRICSVLTGSGVGTGIEMSRLNCTAGSEEESHRPSACLNRWTCTKFLSVSLAAC